MRIRYQGDLIETDARTLGAFIDARFDQREGLLIEHNGDALPFDTDLDARPLEDGADLNVFRMVSGG